MEARKQSMALSMARKLAGKKSAEGGKCHACGQTNPKLEESHMAEGGIVDDEYKPEMEVDTDSDNLENSPEEFGETGFGEVDNDEDGGDNEAKRGNFLKAYLIHRKLRKG